MIPARTSSSPNQSRKETARSSSSSSCLRLGAFLSWYSIEVLLITAPSVSGSTVNSLVKVSFLKISFFLKVYIPHVRKTALLRMMFVNLLRQLYGSWVCHDHIQHGNQSSFPKLQCHFRKGWYQTKVSYQSIPLVSKSLKLEADSLQFVPRS